MLISVMGGQPVQTTEIADKQTITLINEVQSNFQDRLINTHTHTQWRNTRSNQSRNNQLDPRQGRHGIISCPTALWCHTDSTDYIMLN